MAAAKTYRWPGDKPIAVILNICLEAWSDGKAPGITPMGNPLPPAAVDMMAVSWAAYGVKRGIYNLIDVMGRHGAKSSVVINGVIAERAPEAVKAVADAGHEVANHSFGMDVIPTLLSEDDERANIERTTQMLEKAGGVPVKGWLSPRGTPSPRTARMLAEAGYSWYGDVFDDDLPYIERFGDKSIVAIPLSTDVNDMPSLKHGAPIASFLSTFEECLAVARGRADASPSVIDVTVHAHMFGRPRGAHYFDRVIATATRSDDVWIGTRAEIASHIQKTEGG